MFTIRQKIFNCKGSSENGKKIDDDRDKKIS